MPYDKYGRWVDTIPDTANPADYTETHPALADTTVDPNYPIYTYEPGAAAPTVTYPYGETYTNPTTNRASNAGGNGGGGGGAPAVPATPATPKPTLDDTEETLKKSSEYADYLRRRAAAEELFTSGQTTERTQYGQDFTKALEDLGWRADKNAWDRGELLSSGEKATTAGRAYNTLRNDFAARGMIKSGAHRVSDALLTNQLLNQKTEQEKNKGRFEKTLEDKAAAFKQEQENAGVAALNQAKQAAREKYLSDMASWTA